MARRGNTFFALDEVTGDLHVYYRHKLLKREKVFGITHIFKSYSDNEVIWFGHFNKIPKKFIKVMKAKGTHPKLIKALEGIVEEFV